MPPDSVNKKAGPGPAFLYLQLMSASEYIVFGRD